MNGNSNQPSKTEINQQAESSNQSASSPITLRSGKKLQGTSPKINLSKSLQVIYEEARLTGNLSLEQFNCVDNDISRTRESRLKNCSKIRRATEKFKEEIVQFVNTPSFFDINKDIIENSSVSLESEDFQLANWRHTSIENSTQNSFNLSTETNSPNTSLSFRTFKMQNSLADEQTNQTTPMQSSHSFKLPVNYEKVVKLTAQMVPLFSGELSPQLITDLQTFIGCCRQVQQCLDSGEKVAFMQIFPTRLRGTAYQLIASSSVSSFEEVEQLLYRTYLPRETYQELINRLITCRQQPQESFISFASRVKQLLTRCNEAAELKYGTVCYNAVKQQLEDFAIAAIKSGAINPLLSTYLLTLNEKELDPLIQKALDMEKLQQGLPQLQQQTTCFPLGNLATNYPLNNPGQFNFNNNPINVTPCLNSFADTSTSNNTQYPLLNHNQLLPSVEPQKASSVLYNTNSITPPNWPPTQSSFAITSQHTTPFSQSLTNLQPNMASQKLQNKTLNAPLERVKCSYCKYKGHTYDDCIKRKNTPYCGNCKTSGHDTRDCRRNSRPPAVYQETDRGKTATNFATQKIYNVQLQCDFCGRRGHTVTNCRQKQRWEAKNSGNESQSTENSPARL